jgi:hypothetical protein
VGVAVDEDVLRVDLEQPLRPGASELMAVAHVYREPPGVDDVLRFERRTRVIDVPVDRQHRRDGLQLVEDRPAANITGVQNL